MKIAIYAPKSEFKLAQQRAIGKLGQVTYTQNRQSLPISQLLSMAKGADIIAPDPDPFGGFEKAEPQLTKVMDSLPNLKGVCLSTTSFGWIDLKYSRVSHLDYLM